MKEIKFRAWDKKFKVIIKPTDSFADYIGFDGTIHEIGEYSTYSGGGSTDEDVTEQYELMQYTGISDKNGKEIFEGDIATITFVDGIKENFEVYYESNRARFSMRDKDKNDWGFAHTNEIEVIGNIYENAELLEDNPMKQITDV